MSDYKNLFEDSSTGTSAPPGQPEQSGYQDLFAQGPQQTQLPATSSGPDYKAMFSQAAQLGKDAVQTVFPVASTIADVYPTVEKVARPVVSAPITGIGGLISLGQGNSLQDAAAGIRAGKTAGDYVKDVIPDPETTSLWANIAGNLGKEAAGFLTDSAIYTGATEALIGNRVKPLVNVNLDPTVPPESPSLPRPFDVETTLEPKVEEPNGFKDLFKSEAPKNGETPKVGEYENLFEQVNKEPSPTNETPEELKARFAQELEGNFKKELEAIDQGTNEPISMEEPLRRDPDLTAKEQAGINSESGQVVGPQAIQEALAKKFDTAGAFSETAAAKAERHGNIQAKNFEDEQTIRSIVDKLSPAEEHALALTQSGRIPRTWEGTELGNQVKELLAKPTPALAEAQTKMQAFTDKALAELKPVFPNMGGLKKYFPDAWDFDKAPSNLKGGFSTDNPYTHMRTIPDRAQGIDMGLTPKYERPGEALSKYARFKNISIENNVLLDKLTEIKTPEGSPMRKNLLDTKTGKLSPNPDIPMSYVDGNTLSPLWNGYKFPPEMAKEMAFMKTHEVGSWENAYALATSTLKKLALNASFFHHITLSESSIAAQGLGRTLKAAYKVPASFRAGGAPHLMPELAKDALSHNLVLGGIEADVQQGLVTKIGEQLDKGLEYAAEKLIGTKVSEGSNMTPYQWAKSKLAPEEWERRVSAELSKTKTLKGEEESIRQKTALDTVANKLLKEFPYPNKGKTGAFSNMEVMSKLLKPLGKVEELWDKALWAHYHPMLKLTAYENLVSNALREFPKANPDVLKRQVADFVNSAMGGQAWELVFNDPQVKRGLNHMFLALDWTASNIRAAEAFFENGPKGYAARKYWLNMGLLLFASAEMLNGLNKKAQTGKWDWTWNNDKDHKGDVWLYKDDRGMNHYITLNKGAHEPIRWFTDPFKEFGGKLSPLLQMVIEQISGHTITGYDLDMSKPGNRVKALTNHMKPMSMSGNSFLGAFPVSQGISVTKFKSEMETAIYEKDTNKIKELIQTGQNNGLPAVKLYSQIKNQIKGREKYTTMKENESGSTMQVVNRLSKKLGGVTLGEAAQSEFDKIKSKLPKKGQ